VSRRDVHWPDVLARVLAGEDLGEDEAADVMGALMRGEAEAAQVAGLLVALAAKGESPAEIAGFVRAMLEVAEPIEIDLDGSLVDTCGTGGDRAGTFNISTVAALVVAAAGQPVAKHGNRAASGTCGSADLLEAFGLDLELSPEQVATTLRELNIGFLFARRFHPAMRHVAPVRAQLGVRTVFNVLGPLSNPAGAPYQVVGVADERLGEVMAEALARLGKRHALVFRGHDGLDELTTTGPSQVWEVVDGQVRRWELDPRELGIAPASLDDLQGGGVERQRRDRRVGARGRAGTQGRHRGAQRRGRAVRGRPRGRPRDRPGAGPRRAGLRQGAAAARRLGGPRARARRA
jgi:anthranilate phosphoribosyltransferase